MGEIVFVGLGLHDDSGISLRGLEEVKTSDHVFIELYTSLLPDFSLERFEKVAGKTVSVVSRNDLEEDNGRIVLKAAENGKAVLLVPGDPMIATTHVSLRIEAEKHGIKTTLVHGASILSAAIGLSGLHNYKFGRTVTIPFPDETTAETPYAVIAQNKELGLHTLCLLDIKTQEKRYLSIHDGLHALLRVEVGRKKSEVTMNTLAVGIARAGSKNPTIKADSINNLLNQDFGEPPQCLIFPGRLHFMEAEALITFAGAPEQVRRAAE